MRLLVPLVLLIVSVACSRPAPDAPRLMADALLAQAAGPGGCRELGKSLVTTNGFFPAVRFHEAPCLREHGDTVVVNAAIDDDGTPFLLSSQSDFRFLLSRHPPVGIDSGNVVDYALMALFLTGEIAGWAELVRDSSSGVQDFPHGVRIVWVTVSTGGDSYRYGTSVDSVSGEWVNVQKPGDR
jgi:hypothetical protein